MDSDAAFDEINDAKANMDHIYDRADPRAYFRELRSVGYTIPGSAKPILQKLISHLRGKTDDTVRVLDIGCSYGINTALLKHDLSIYDLYDHWGNGSLADATSEEVIARDRDYFAGLDDAQDIEVIGLDVAENAVAFGKRAGLLAEGLAMNLESEPLPEDAARELAPVDLVISTGCVGYVTEKSFEQLLPAVTKDGQTWFANFVLRMFPFGAIEDTLSNAGFVTEKLDGQTFVQREFASDEERTLILEQIRGLGLDPTGKETEGHLLAEFFLSRPEDDAAKVPLKRLLNGAATDSSDRTRLTDPSGQTRLTG